MVANLNGVVFSQIYPDNSGGAVFDTDGDGTATQEDEFVSVQNTSGVAVDISGYQIWSNSIGAGAPDSAQDGLYHTFPPGTVLNPGQTLFIVNEYSGTLPSFVQEASEGGLESGAGGVSTNLLTEGQAEGSASESIGLVDPSSGDYIVFNMADSSGIEGVSGFPGTNNIGEIDGQSVQNDANAGFSYQYNEVTDSYEYLAVFIPCFAAGTHISTPRGEVLVEALEVGDLVDTMDHGPQPLQALFRRRVDLTKTENHKHKPYAFAPGSLGRGTPERRLVVSPQHRMLITTSDGNTALMPAKGLVHLAGVRLMCGKKYVEYIQLVFARHEIVRSDGAWTESFLPGRYAFESSHWRVQQELMEIFPELAMGQPPTPARQLLRVRDRESVQRPERQLAQA